MRTFAALACILTAVSVLSAAQEKTVRVDINGIASEVRLNDITFAGRATAAYAPWRRGPSAAELINIIGNAPLSGTKWEKYTISFVPSRNGEITLLFRSNTGGNRNIDWIAYDGISVSGAAEALRNPSFETVLRGAFEGWDIRYRENMRINTGKAFHGKNYIVGSHDFYAMQTIAVTGGERVTVSFYARFEKRGSGPEKFKLPALPKKDPSYYRLYHKDTKLVPLADKGLYGKDIMPRYPMAPKPGAAPRAGFIGKMPVKEVRQPLRRIPFELLEEDGVARLAEVRFGIPFKRGELFDLSHLRIVDAGGRRIPAQFAATTLYPDKTVKNVIAHFSVPMKPRERSTYFCEYGPEVGPASPPSPLRGRRDGGVYRVETGRLSAKIDLRKFRFLEEVTVDGKKIGSFAPEGLVFTMEDGEKRSTADGRTTLTVEESGARRLALRLDTVIADRAGKPLFKVVSRLGFTAESPVVQFDVQCSNIRMEREFTDFASLELRFVPQIGPPEKILMDGEEFRRIFQHHDRKLQTGARIADARMSDGGTVQCGGGKLTFMLRDAALRYPKAFSVKDGAFVLELLPEQGSPDFGRDLPHYLAFPYCEGFYRTKWGMSFSERFAVDFSGDTPAEVLAAREVIPVIDRDYLASTGVYPGISPRSCPDFDPIDRAAVEGFRVHMRNKDAMREYGFFNYGDWFGERGRNWGNNEYDLAHGLFMLFLRTGERDCARWAQRAARHCADVDIVKAYPDPAYVGANTEHTTGHTGQGIQAGGKPQTWSQAYDIVTYGTNGHTWSEGMTENYLLFGDALSMDSALLLGEHLTNFVAPYFLRLTTHERSAGWSNTAILGIYRATGDEKYLAASRRLMDCILAEQKPRWGGAWPHRMPSDHGGGKANTYGNCPYLVGILVTSMRRYYEEAPDERVKNAIIMASLWQYRSFVPSMLGAGYGVSWDNHKYQNTIGTDTNALEIPVIALGARLSGERKLYDLASLLLAYEGCKGFSGDGKTLGMQLAFLPDMLDDMRLYAQEHPDVPPFACEEKRILDAISDVKFTADEVASTGGEFVLRGPLEKTFGITLTADGEASGRIIRRARGLRPGGETTFSCKLITPNGAVLARKEGGADQPLSELPFTVSGKAGDRFIVCARDDYKGGWTVRCGEGAKAAIIVEPTAVISTNNGLNAVIEPPPGVRRFTLKFRTFHHIGVFRCLIFLPDGKLLTAGAGVTFSQRMAWEPEKRESSCRIPVELPDGVTSCRAVVLAGGDIQIDVEDTAYVSVRLQPNQRRKEK